ncbi:MULTISPECIES: cytochrome c oxidase assembly protein [unclassified Saccharopolyspora]|uniref:cytochrome c oxidase assembly protein n=1 Tax=unclassified Saccharopolyspora TaxID=2646250 RepID=UPI001CD74FF9|nr:MULTISPECIES: cytochrome c oxidase assembly protein [unclassified Saccharopolyspora]MCA1189002.1 bifunctional copper resistance protein CopD/cytochrome c oxidase assembly protein [Saccharopolyspora sp. 6T]MCA1281908.1 bifunctional copper resistance protein CopD/cytochrome c oxidase assembly protein [Saccharopolyspora sp. 7B]
MPPPGSQPPHRLPWIAGASIAALVSVFVAVFLGESGYAALGLSDPGAVVRVGIGLVRLVADASAAITLGSLAFAAFFTSPRESGGIAPDGFAAVRAAGAAAWVWAVAAVLMMPFEMADGTGHPLRRVLPPDAFTGLFSAMYEPTAWAITAGVALVVAVGARTTLRWRPALGLTALAAFALLPPAVVGHSASNAGHDFGTNAIVLHVLAAALWMGLLAAVIAHLRRGGAHRELVLRRYRRFAGVSWLVLAVSGLVDALVLMPLSDLGRTAFGVLVLAKIVLLVLLGACGSWVRRRSSAPVALLSAELLIMLVSVGVSMGMAQTPPPNLLDRGVSSSEVILGYDLPGPPSAWGFLGTWRFDLVLGLAVVVLAALYVAGVRRLRRRGDRWPAGRTAAWLLGCATVLVATSSGLGVYSSGVFSVHMLVHMVLNMLAPVLLVLGGPITLALRALPTAGRGNPHGAREVLLAVVHSPVARAVAHPAIATVLFVGSFYALYFTPLFENAMSEHWAHELMNVHFVLVGYLYYWTVIGVDPAPKPLPHLGRLGMVFAVMPFHAFFGVIVMGMNDVIAENFYRTLDLPWAQDLLADQKLGGGIAWAAGEAPLVVVLIALLTQWYRHDARVARRADRSGDEELAAYNAMLAKLAERR